MKKQLVLLSVAALAVTACGSSDGATATASEGDSFCKLAQVAADDHDGLDSIDISDTAKVKLSVSASIDSLSAAVAKAPKDIADTAKALLAQQEKLEKLLEKYDYDIIKMTSSDDGKALVAESDKSTDSDDFDAYLTDKCGIARPDDSSDDTTPVDTVAVDDTSGSDISVDLGEGEDAINKFLDLYVVGTGATLTDDDRACIVDALKDKVTGDDLNEAMAGNASDTVSQALGLAFIGCNVEVKS